MRELLESSFIALSPYIAFNKQQDNQQSDKKLVGKIKGAGYSKMDKAKELLEEHPTLINAAQN